MKGVVARMIADRLHAPPRLSPWNKAVSPAVESIVRQCLEPKPSKRYQSARELREDIQRHLDHLPLRFASEPSLKERAGQWMRRHPRLSSMTTVGTLAVLLVAALSAAFVVRGEQLKHFRAKEVLSAFEKEVTSAQLLLYDRNADQKQLADGVASAKLPWTAIRSWKIRPGTRRRRLLILAPATKKSSTMACARRCS